LDKIHCHNCCISSDLQAKSLQPHAIGADATPYQTVTASVSDVPLVLYQNIYECPALLLSKREAISTGAGSNPDS
jgi:hypothetical protein